MLELLLLLAVEKNGQKKVAHVHFLAEFDQTTRISKARGVHAHELVASPEVAEF